MVSRNRPGSQVLYGTFSAPPPLLPACARVNRRRRIAAALAVAGCACAAAAGPVTALDPASVRAAAGEDSVPARSADRHRPRGTSHSGAAIAAVALATLGLLALGLAAVRRRRRRAGGVRG
jgi:hypothetical protein